MKNSNIEKLRIISMLLIIMYHANRVMTEFASESLPLRFESTVIGMWGILGVDLFLIISCWFMQEREFKTSRAFGLLFHMATYIVLFVIGWFVEQLVQGNEFLVVVKQFVVYLAKEIISPIWAKDYWFVTAYILLCFVSPLLNRLLSCIDERMLKKILILFSFVPIYANFQGGQSTVVDVVFFVYVYLFVAFLKRNHDVFQRIKLPIAFAVASIQIVFNVLYTLTNRESFMGQITGFFYYFFGNIGRYSIITLCIAIMIFILVTRKKAKTSPVVNSIAKHTLGVYFFHDNQLINITEQVCIWTHTHNLLSVNPVLFPLEYMILGIVIFAIGLLFESVRFHALQHPFVKFADRKYEMVFKKIDCWINGEREEAQKANGERK